MSLSSRLAKLSYTQLLNFAVEACEGSPKLKNKADALVAQVAPLPSWCVDILLSPDLLYAAQGSKPSLADCAERVRALPPSPFTHLQPH